MRWRELVKTDVPALPSPPRVEVQKQASGKCVARVTNTMEQPIFYRAYSASSPATYIEERRWGRWEDTSYAWCGTGMKEYRLAPQQTQVFPLFDDSPRPRTRAYMIFYTAESRSSSLVLLSPPPPGRRQGNHYTSR